MNPPESHPELHGLDPGELLARGINTAHPSGPVHEWTPPTPDELARLLPQYRIESLIGRGGMGAVYKGSQEKLGRTVAIKVLPVELTADAQFVTRFEREARTLAKLHHPGIVSIYDFGQTGDGHLYFVMEYVEGTDLRRVLQGPGLAPAQALEITTQICEALHAAHLQGVVHRDIKPANILITSDGRVKLADFGLARPETVDAEPITVSNVILGTPDYMAPEQHAGQADLRTDIYALGLMLYEMLTGQLPRGAWTPPSRKVQVDVRIDEVVLKALQEEPDLRYQQASEMKTDVDSIRSGVRTPAPTLPQPTAGRRLVAAALIIAGLAAAGLGFLFFGGPAKPAHIEMHSPPPLTPSLVGGNEEPLSGNTNLRRIVFKDTDAGISKQIFLPADPSSGLIVRYRSSADLPEHDYDIDDVWEWIQVPPASGGNENFVQLIQEIPDWAQDQQGERLENIRLLSGTSTGNELFAAEGIPVSSVSMNPKPEGVEYILRRKIDGEEEIFLQFEILPVPHQDLKAKYPTLRGPGETAGEVAMWIDDTPLPDDATSPTEPVGTRPPPPSSLERALLDFRWDYVAAKPSSGDSASRWFSHAFFFQADGYAYSIGRSTQLRYSWKTTGTHSLRLERGDEIVDLAFSPSFKDFTGEGSDGFIWNGRRSRLRTSEDRKMLAGRFKGSTPLLVEASSPTDQYDGLAKFLYSPTAPDLGLVVRYTASPAFMMEWTGDKFEKDTVREWAIKKPMPGEELQTRVTQGWPVWLVGEEVAGGEYPERAYTLRLGYIDDGSILRVERFPSLRLLREVQKDAEENVNGYVLNFQHYKDNTISSAEDVGENWLRVEITALPVAEIEKRYPRLRSDSLYSAMTVNTYNGITDTELDREIATPPSPTPSSSPDDLADTYRKLAYAAAQKGDAALSKEYSQKAIALRPDDIWSWASFGWCLFNLDLHSEALAAWRKAYEINPDAYRRINVCLALALDKIGEEKEALRHYSEQVKIDPDFGKEKLLLETTSFWKPKEKAALRALYIKWRSFKGEDKKDDLKISEIPENEYGLKKTVYAATGERSGLVVRWTATNPVFLGEWEREQGFDAKTIFELVQLPAKGGENSITLISGEPLWNRKEREKIGHNTFMVQFRAGHGAQQSPGYAFISADMIPSVGVSSELEKPAMNRASIKVRPFEGTRISETEIWLNAEIRALPLEEIFKTFPGLEKTYSADSIQSNCHLFIDGKPAPEEAY